MRFKHTKRKAKHNTRNTGVGKFRIWGFLGATAPCPGPICVIMQNDHLPSRGRSRRCTVTYLCENRSTKNVLKRADWQSVVHMVNSNRMSISNQRGLLQWALYLAIIIIIIIIIMPRYGEGNVTVLFRAPRPVNMISFDFKQFSFKLFVSAQSWKCLSSLALVSELTVGRRWYNNVCIVSEFDQRVAYVYWLEVRRSDDERRWAYCRALDDAGQDVRQFGSVAVKSGALRMATE